METLPNEILELIVRKLSPRDLAHSSAVCRSWYKTLNQDWIWAPYCDPELEEPLQTIPSVATPTFEIPETETLPPISRWKWAFLREKHLWMNWRPEKVDQFKEENIVVFKNKYVLCVDFFSDTSVVVLYRNKIEILDVSVIPATIAAETGLSEALTLNLHDNDNVCGDGTNMLLVGNAVSIKVFNVDVENKSITLKHCLDISFDKSQIAKENIYIFYNGWEEKMTIGLLDLNTGKILKDGITFPEEMNEKKITITRVNNEICSPTSDFVVVVLSEDLCEDNDKHFKILVYSLKQFKYLPSPEIKSRYNFGQILLHDHWIALQQNSKVTIYNISQTKGVVFSDEIGLPPKAYLDHSICNGCFVIRDRFDTFGYSYVGIYSPTSKTLTAIDDETGYCFEVINNKLIALSQSPKKYTSSPHCSLADFDTVLRVWNQKVEKCDFSFSFSSGVWKTNPSFTKLVNMRSSEHGNFWYISYLW